jgi:hypothetical protein
MVTKVLPCFTVSDQYCVGGSDCYSDCYSSDCYSDFVLIYCCF